MSFYSSLGFWFFLRRILVFYRNNIGQLVGIKEAQLTEQSPTTQQYYKFIQRKLDRDDNKRMEAATIAWLS